MKKKAGNLSKEQQKISDLVNKYLGRAAEIAAEAKRDGTNDAFVKIREYFAQLAENFQEEIQKTSSALSNVFYFCEDVFEKGNEMLILVTELTENYYAAKYIGQYGCREYFKYNKELLFYERQQNIVKELEELGL